MDTTFPLNVGKIETLLCDAESQDVVKQVTAIEDLVHVVDAIGIRVVDAFVHSQNRYLIAERLHRFGQCVVKPLKKAVQSTTDDEVRILGSIVLLQLGCHVGVPSLLDTIKTDSEYLCITARALANARLTAALIPIENRLRTMECSTKIDKDNIICLLLAHAKMGATLPSDLAARFTAEGVHWEIRSIITGHK